MRFADVKHQDRAIEQLQRGLRGDRVGHAYLFEGPDGVGKEMLAERFARVLLCAKPAQVSAPDGGKWAEACGKCDDCVLFDAGNHPDYHRVHRSLNRHHPDPTIRRRKATVLSVDVIRHFLIDQIGHRPSRGRAKVFVVAEAERMNDAAQNALLKTLEEPPGAGYLLLLTTSAGVLLATTRSRCQTVSLRPLPTAFVAESLVSKFGANPADAAFLAELAQGRLGAAARWLKSGLPERLPEVLAAMKAAPSDALGAGKALLDLAKEMAKGDKSRDASAGADDSGTEEADADEAADRDDNADVNAAREAQGLVLAMAATVLRDVLRGCVGTPPAAVADAGALRQLSARATPDGVSGAIRAMADATMQVERSVNTGLIFDGVGIALSRGLTGERVASAVIAP